MLTELIMMDARWGGGYFGSGSGWQGTCLMGMSIGACNENKMSL